MPARRWRSTYEELPAVVALDKAHEVGSLVHDEVERNLCFDWELGDRAATDAAFANAARVVTLDLVNNRVAPNAHGAARRLRPL